MKATKTQIPALLGDQAAPSTWHLYIKTRHAQVDMTFSNKTMAEGEFKRIKAQAQFGGQWLTEITLEEIKDVSK